MAIILVVAKRWAVSLLKGLGDAVRRVVTKPEVLIVVKAVFPWVQAAADSGQLVWSGLPVADYFAWCGTRNYGSWSGLV